MTRRASHSRRDFLRRGSVVVAGAIAAPYLIPEGVLASEGKAGANDRIGIAGIGVDAPQEVRVLREEIAERAKRKQGGDPPA